MEQRTLYKVFTNNEKCATMEQERRQSITTLNLIELLGYLEKLERMLIPLLNLVWKLQGKKRKVEIEE